LGRYGLFRGSFIPPRDLRELRLLSRYRKKLVALLAAEKNRLHKLLDDAVIKLGGLVADINGKAAQAIVDGLIDGQPASELIKLSGRLRAPKEDLLASLDGLATRCCCANCAALSANWKHVCADWAPT
jgi:transposase